MPIATCHGTCSYTCPSTVYKTTGTIDDAEFESLYAELVSRGHKVVARCGPTSTNIDHYGPMWTWSVYVKLPSHGFKPACPMNLFQSWLRSMIYSGFGVDVVNLMSGIWL